MGSSGSKGGTWTNKLVFIDYNEDNKPIETELDEEHVVRRFQGLGANDEKILKAKIWKHALTGLTGLVGDWHEYTVVESTNWYWSFEKQMDAIYVQRSREEANVKNKLNGGNRSTRIRPEGRSNNNVEYGENICNVIEWIINKGELSNTYHLTQKAELDGCHSENTSLVMKYDELQMKCSDLSVKSVFLGKENLLNLN
ncbi:hypothetical protein FO519_009423 [Halicephalobus sp. NKZ332]|nr:hypothetical protein FO519_009423 [Halicephalobus sp. NKZ332]